MIVLHSMLCVCFKLCMFYALWLFDVAKGGEKMGILEIKILYFKIKHKFKNKGERGMSEQ